VSSESAKKSNVWLQAEAQVSPHAGPHEPRVAFRPAERPGRRAAAAGLDSFDLAERQEHTRRSAPRRRERLSIDQGYE
jgi:hypothetical protein